MSCGHACPTAGLDGGPLILCDGRVWGAAVWPDFLQPCDWHLIGGVLSLVHHALGDFPVLVSEYWH